MADRRKGVEHVLQSCLEEVMNGQETIDAAVARYPQWEAELRSQLESAVWIHTRREKLDPSPDFVTVSRRRVVANAARGGSVNEASTPFALSISLWRSWLKSRSFQLAFAFILLAVLLIGGKEVNVNAQASLPGERWYRVKLAQEKIALVLSFDKANDALLSLEFTRRRLNEVKALITDGRYENVDALVTDLESQVHQTLRSIDEVAAQDTLRAQLLAEAFEELLNDENKDLGDLFAIVSPMARPSLENAMRISLDGVAAVRELLGNIPPASPPTDTPAPTRPPVSSPTPTSIPTSTPAPSASPTATATLTPRPTPTPLPTARLQPSTPTRTPTNVSITSTPTLRVTPTALPSLSITPPFTPTPVLSPTFTAWPTDLPTYTPLPTDTAAPTVQPSDTPIPTQTWTPTASPTLMSTATPEATSTSTSTPTPTSSVTVTPTPTVTPPPG